MPNIIEELKRTPIERNPRFDYGSYFGNETYCHRELIRKISVDRENPLHMDPMEKCSKHGIKQFNYYIDGPGASFIQNLGVDPASVSSRDIYLRKRNIQRLREADEFLRENSSYRYRLIVLSGYRKPLLQKFCIEGVKKQKRRKDARPAEKLFTDPLVYSPHPTGGAFDVEIYDTRDSRMNLTKLRDNENTIGLFFLEDLHVLDNRQEEARSYRRLLHNLLATPTILGDEHFIPHPSEYWHYGWGERMSAFFAANGHPVYYEMLIFSAP